jgi:soluble lytic murein transglycosylase-like protein
VQILKLKSRSVAFVLAQPGARPPQVRRLVAGTLAAGLVMAAHGPLMAQIYTGPSRAGLGVILSNFHSAETPILLIAEPALPTATAEVAAPPNKSVRAMPSASLRLPFAPADLHRVIDDVAAQVNIAPELLHAVIAAESRYDTHALSQRGAMGLMQLMPATALRFGARDPYAPRQNVLAGASYLKWLMTLFQNDLELVLAAFNAGEQAVLKAGRRIPPYPETQAYVPRVLAYLRCARSAACKPA